VTNEKKAAHDVTPDYVAETICWKRLAAWHTIWQTVFFIGSYASLLMLNRSSTVENVSICFASSGAFSAPPDPLHESANLRKILFIW